MAFRFLKDPDEKGVKKVQKDVLRRSKELASCEVSSFIDGADGIYEIGGKTYYCFTKETLEELIEDTSAWCFLPSEF